MQITYTFSIPNPFTSTRAGFIVLPVGEGLDVLHAIDLEDPSATILSVLPILEAKLVILLMNSDHFDDLEGNVDIPQYEVKVDPATMTVSYERITHEW